MLLDRLDGSDDARLAVEAASPSGTIIWPDGTTATRQGPVPSGSAQSIPQQMLTTITMQVSGGTSDGVTAQGLATMMSKMFNKQMTSEQVDTSSAQATRQSQSDLLSKIITSTNNQSPVSAGINLTDAKGQPAGGREVLVNSVNLNGNGGGAVDFTNPWGDEETLSLNDFMSRFNAIDYDPSTVTVAANQLQKQQRVFAQA